MEQEVKDGGEGRTCGCLGVGGRERLKEMGWMMREGEERKSGNG